MCKGNCLQGRRCTCGEVITVDKVVIDLATRAKLLAHCDDVGPILRFFQLVREYQVTKDAVLCERLKLFNLITHVTTKLGCADAIRGQFLEGHDNGDHTVQHR